MTIVVRWAIRASGLLLFTVVVTAVLLEITLRPAAYFLYGRSAYYLLYGLHGTMGRVGVNPKSTFQGEHYTFPPHYQLRGAAGQSGETASTNSKGFRGPDFASNKAAGVFRVICLGESSTFGYHNRDNETYPVYLQRLLDLRGLKTEVINAGFPYYNTGSIISLLTSELLTYEPDLLTLYAGYNDTSWPTELGAMGKTVLWINAHSITHLLAKNAVGDFVTKVERRVYKRAIPQLLQDSALEANADLVAARYRNNLAAIVDVARARAIPVILIRQPVTRREAGYEALTYEAENRIIRERLERGERLTDIETWMLKHHRLMGELDAAAAAWQLPVVDNIQIVDRDRRRLASWVHLTAEGNQRLAEALEAVITPFIVRTQPSSSSVVSHDARQGR
jgi:lysophospholipase L1-like esterase